MVFLFGDKLKELRKNSTSKENGLTQEELGEKLGVGKTTISNWEKNITQPPFETVKEIAEYFNVTTDYLLGVNQEDLDKIEKLNIALREAGLVNKDETLKEEEIKLAIDQARQYKILWKQVNDLPNKYPDNSEKKETNEDTNK